MSGSSQHITLHIEGMDCANCATSITKNLEKKGMKEVFVDFATGEATFFIEDKNKLQTAINSVTELGYKVTDSKFGEERIKGLSRIEKRFYFTLPFTVVLFFSHMLFSHDFILNRPYVQLILCIPVFIIGIVQFGKSAWGSLKTGVPNMDVLIFIGSTAAFIYSLLGMYLYPLGHAHHYLFFETTATIITLVLLGNVLEHRAVKRTTSAIQDLTAMQVNTAKIVSLQLGKEIITEIDIKNIPPGAILQVNTGDKIPADGEIITGETSIDESMLTGESIPVEKGPSAKVISGTIVLKGNFRMRAESIGDQTVLARIIEMVKKAQQNKPGIQKLGDKISAIFVPVVLGISILTFILSYFVFDITIQQAMMSSIAVLVVSCPCAMGLATPTAVMVGIGRAAKNGILIKGGNTLEEFAKVKTIVFDKTGTLSTGNFRIKKINHLTNHTPEVQEVLLLLEQHSSHPIAKSIVRHLKDIPVSKKLTSVTEEKGIGVSGRDEQNNFYRAGSYKIASHLTREDDHNIYLLKNDQLIATVDMEDELRENVKKTIEDLRRQNILTVLLSGDLRKKCESFAQKISIEKVYCEQTPSQKLHLIDEFVKQKSTAMVGDGINDAPALAKASVGVSLSSATQVAIQSAQVILLKNDLNSLLEAKLISKHTLITIKQNLFWAFFYNIITIPIAAMGFLNPMIAALSMAFSDIIVIGNSIRLKSKKLS